MSTDEKPEPCPRCGSTERIEKFTATICAKCRIVLVQR